MRQVLKSSEKTGVIIAYLGLAVSVIGNLIITKKVLNFVGDYQFGLLSFVNSITTWFTVISAALSSSFIRFATIERNQNGNECQVKSLYNTAFFIVAIIVFSVGLSIISVLRFSGRLLFHYPKETSDILYSLFLISITQISISILFSVYGLFINYRKRFVFSRSASLLLNVFLFIGNYFVAFISHDIVCVALFGCIHALVSSLINIFYVRVFLKERHFALFKEVDGKLKHSVFVFSGILLFGTIVSQINNQVDKTIIGLFGKPETVTVYQLGHSFSSYFILLSSAVSSIFVPSVNDLVVAKKDSELNTLFLNVSRFQTIIMCLCAYGFLTCGKEFIVLWVGDNKVESYYVASSWLLLLTCSETMNLSIEIQRARNKHFFRCICFFGLSLFNILLSLFFIRLFKKEKIIFACLLGTIISGILSNWIGMNVYNKVKMKLPIGKYLINLLIHSLFGVFSFSLVCVIERYTPLLSGNSIIAIFFEKGALFVLFYCCCAIIYNWDFIKTIIARRRNN